MGRENGSYHPLETYRKVGGVAYESQKESLADMANSSWVKLVMGMLTSKMQEDKVDAELPDIDALIKESSSDEFIRKKINDILGDN